MLIGWNKNDVKTPELSVHVSDSYPLNGPVTNNKHQCSNNSAILVSFPLLQAHAFRQYDLNKIFNNSQKMNQTIKWGHAMGST